ncbi:helix-turn-helix domain-containing protein [Salmonella enterica]|nr:helix-turn-helix domain-containing protein [Salmonella enterica]
MSGATYVVLMWCEVGMSNFIKEVKMSSLLSAKAVCHRLDMHRATLYRKIKAGEIPAPFKDGPRSKWKEEDIQAYIDKLSNVNR